VGRGPLWPPAWSIARAIPGATNDHASTGERAAIKARPTTPHHPRPYGILGWHLQGIYPGILLCSHERYIYGCFFDSDLQLIIYSAYMYLAMLGNVSQQDTQAQRDR